MRILDPHDNVLLCESTSLAAGLTYILSTKQGWDPALDSWVTHRAGASQLIRILIRHAGSMSIL